MSSPENADRENRVVPIIVGLLVLAAIGYVIVVAVRARARAAEGIAAPITSTAPDRSAPPLASSPDIVPV